MTATYEPRIHLVVSEADELERMGFTAHTPPEFEWNRICPRCSRGRQFYVQGGRYGQYLHDMTVHAYEPVLGGGAGH